MKTRRVQQRNDGEEAESGGQMDRVARPVKDGRCRARRRRFDE